MATPIRVGARDLPSATANAKHVATRILEHSPGLDVTVHPITTTADFYRGSIATIGGKGAYLDALDNALRAGIIDIAVHNLKDIPTHRPIPDDLTLAAHLPRDDPRDALIHRTGMPLHELPELPKLTTVHTSSWRRLGQINSTFPNVKVRQINGDTTSRLERYDAGDIDSLIISAAELHRLGHEHRITQYIPTDVLLPAAAAGIRVLQTRTEDTLATAIARQLNDHDTALRASAERAVLRTVGIPPPAAVAAHATLDEDGTLRVDAGAFCLTGRQQFVHHKTGPKDDAELIGRTVGQLLLFKGARDLATAWMTAPTTLFG